MGELIKIKKENVYGNMLVNEYYELFKTRCCVSLLRSTLITHGKIRNQTQSRVSPVKLTRSINNTLLTTSHHHNHTSLIHSSQHTPKTIFFFLNGDSTIDALCCCY